MNVNELLEALDRHEKSTKKFLIDLKRRYSENLMHGIADKQLVDLINRNTKSLRLMQTLRKELINDGQEESIMALVGEINLITLDTDQYYTSL